MASSGGSRDRTMSPVSASQKREYSGRQPETFAVSSASNHEMGRTEVKAERTKPAIGGAFR